MLREEFVAQCEQIVKEWEEGLITTSDRDAYLDDISLEYEQSLKRI